MRSLFNNKARGILVKSSAAGVRQNSGLVTSSLELTAAGEASEVLLVGAWECALEEKFGTGTHRLRRGLFKELCDEMRSEIHTIPPPPYKNWKVHHANGTSVVHFTCSREHNLDAVDCLAIARLKFADPPGKADHSPLVDNHFVDIFIERNGVVMNYEVALVERYLEVKNIKVFRKDALDGLTNGEGTLAVTAAKINERRTELYDGPSIHHLEEDFYNELHDLTVTADMDDAFKDWVVRWISYLEHLEYVRWSLSVQDSILSHSSIEVPELLTEVENDVARETIDTWRRDDAKV